MRKDDGVVTITILSMRSVWPKVNNIKYEDLSEVYLLPIKVCIETSLKDFQFKILNYITCTTTFNNNNNIYLYQKKDKIKVLHRI